MKRIVILLFTLLATVAYAQQANQDYTYLRITPVGVDGGINGINDFFQLVGYNNGHAFLYNAGRITSIDYPGAHHTIASGINNLGQVTGSIDPSLSPAPSSGCSSTSEAFIWSKGKFKRFQYPGACVTVAKSINDRGQIVGNMSFTGGYPIYGFLYDNGSFQQLPMPAGGFNFDLGAINNQGVIAGVYYSNDLPYVISFTYKDGIFTNISAPFSGMVYTLVTGINSFGTVVGIDEESPKHYGFTLHGKTTTLLDYKLGESTQAFAINNAGIVAGRSWVTDKNGNQKTFGIVAIPKKPH